MVIGRQCASFSAPTELTLQYECGRFRILEDAYEERRAVVLLIDTFCTVSENVNQKENTYGGSEVQVVGYVL
jgi:hypothetical protein